MAEKYAAKGAILRVSDGTASPTMLTIANFRSISSSGGEAERIDVTTHDSPGGRREFRAGFKGETSVTFEILYDPAETTHQELATLYGSGEVRAWELELKTQAQDKVTFSAYVANFPIPQNPIDNAITVEVALQVTGDITFPGVGG